MASFDDLVGARENRWRDRQPERLRGLQVDHQLESGRLLHRQVGGLGAFQDLVNKCRSAPEKHDKVWAVRDQAAIVRELAKAVNRWDPVASREGDYLVSVRDGERVVQCE